MLIVDPVKRFSIMDALKIVIDLEIDWVFNNKL